MPLDSTGDTMHVITSFGEPLRLARVMARFIDVFPISVSHRLEGIPIKDGEQGIFDERITHVRASQSGLWLGMVTTGQRKTHHHGTLALDPSSSTTTPPSSIQSSETGTVTPSSSTSYMDMDHLFVNDTSAIIVKRLYRVSIISFLFCVKLPQRERKGV
jgi:hypothetical protein